MYWTLELASYLSDAPWPANKDELIDYAIRAGAPLEVVENLQSIEDEGEIYDRWKRFGRITLQTKIIFGMRMNIKYNQRKKVSKRFWLNLHFKIIRNTNIL
jgi:hypothetical protein